jgi:hypothetical protein
LICDGFGGRCDGGRRLFNSLGFDALGRRSIGFRLFFAGLFFRPSIKGARELLRRCPELSHHAPYRAKDLWQLAGPYYDQQQEHY